MKKSFPKLNITLELNDDTIMVRETSSTELLKAKVFRPDEVVEKFNHLVKVYTDKESRATLK